MSEAEISLRRDDSAGDDSSSIDGLHGFVHPDFVSVATALRRQLRPEKSGGAAVCVFHRGECVVDVWGGVRNGAGDPWRQDTLAMSFSTTKGVVSTLLHVLVDRGMLDYDDPVTRYWPEFGQAGKQSITVRQLLCHEAGLFDIRSLIDDAHQMLDWDAMVHALERAAPEHVPGDAHGYHGLTWGWLVGELIKRVTGESLGVLLRREIAEPLAVEGLYIGLPESELGRRATLQQQRFERGVMASALRRSRLLSKGLRLAGIPVDLGHLEAALLPRGIEHIDWNGDEIARACIPAANGFFTAHALARMYAALALGGTINGVQLLSRATLARATEVQNSGLGRVVPFPMHWRLGYHRVPVVRPRHPRAFGHFGFGGSGAWADPARQLSVAFTLNRGVGTPFGDTRILRLGVAAVGSADKR